MFLQLKGLKKIYEEEKGLKNLDLEIEEGSFVTLLGPSGCGKTTTLNLLGGFTSRIPAISFWKGRTSQAFRRSAVLCPRSSRAMRCFLI